MIAESQRVKAFCVGQAKSGTASLVGLLSAKYRAAHEPEREELLGMILRESHADFSEYDFREYLVERDDRLDLEYDVAWANQFIVGHLLPVFPTAKFIVLIRDCYTWLQSVLGHLISRDVPSDVLAFLEWWFKPERYPYSHHDRPLEEYGLYSIASYLHAWNHHINVCTASIPPERRLLLRTHELALSHSKLAGFLEIPLESIDSDNGHLNRSTWVETIESLVGRSYLDEMVHSICGDNMACYFPEIGSAEDVPNLWQRVPGEAQ